MPIPTTLGADLEFKQLVPATDTTNAALYYVGVDLTLTQADVPYAQPDGERIQSTTDLFVFADTVTIAGNLVNPGAAIQIIARQINAGASTILDVSGAPALTSWPAGVPAEQSSTAPGAAGPTGAPGTNGFNGGRIQLYADVFKIGAQNNGNSGNAARNLAQVLPEVVAAALAQVAQSGAEVPITLGPVQSFGWSYTPQEAVVALPVMSLVSASYDEPSSMVTLALSGPLNIVAQFLFNGEPQPTPTYISGQIGLTITVPVGSHGSAPTNSFSLLNLIATTPVSVEPGVIIQQQLPGYVTGALASVAPFNSALDTLTTALANAIQTAAQGLILLAAGGDGGRGQDGGDGNPGAMGPQGQSVNYSIAPDASPPPECYGGQGLIGGQCGDAGTSGQGGNGGTIVVGGVMANPAVAPNVQGGNGGDAATWGGRGMGGPGGPGGNYYVTFLSRPPKTVKETAPAGQQGPPGAWPSYFGAAGGAGQQGNANVASASYDAIAPFILLGQLQFQQQAAKFAYMNAAAPADYENVLTLYNWLYNVTLLFSQQTSVPNLAPADIAARKAMNAAVAVELARLSRKLDYFGNVLNWAPVLSVDFYETRINELIALGTTINSQLTNYQSQEQAEQLAALTATQATLQADLVNINGSVSALETEIGNAEANITQLNVQISQQQELIVATITSDELSALKQATGCATFQAILGGVSAIVAFGSALEGINSLQTALKAVNAGNSAYSGGKSMLQVLAPSQPDFSSLNTTYNSISTLLQNNPTAAQIAVDQTQFNTLVSNYFNANAAAVLEAQMQQLINLSQTRNKAVLAVTAQYLKLGGFNAQIAQKSAELNHVSALLAAANPSLPDLIAFMQRAIQDTLAELVDNLWNENQAYSYLYLSPQPFALQGLDLGSLTNTANSLATQIENYKSANGPFDQFQDEMVTIGASDFPSAFENLVATKQLTLSIPLNAAPFDSLYQITVDTVAVGLLGVTPPPGGPTNPTLLTVVVTQCGPDILRSPPPNSTVFTFSHQPLSTTYQFNYTTGEATVDGDIGDPNQGYSGLSPFATWILDFTSTDNAWLDLSKITGVTLTFSGRTMSAK